MAKSAQGTKHLVESREVEIDGPLKDVFQLGRHKYLMVNVISARARELNRGEPTLVRVEGPVTHTELALAELGADKLQIKRKQKSKVLVSLIKNE